MNKKILKDLDWDTQLNSVDIGKHWRIGVCILLMVVISATIWHFIFPHTMPFLKLWCGFATGSVLGIIVGVIWQFKDEDRRKATSGKFLSIATLAWGVFAIMALVMLAPQMKKEEYLRSLFRSLKAQDIQSIILVNDDKNVIRINEEKVIKQFCAIANEAELFYRSHEINIEEYSISIIFKSGETSSYQAGIPERHANDLSLSFRGPAHYSDIILPGGRKWIKEVKSKSQQGSSDNQSTASPSSDI